MTYKSSVKTRVMTNLQIVPFCEISKSRCYTFLETTHTRFLQVEKFSFIGPMYKTDCKFFQNNDVKYDDENRKNTDFADLKLKSTVALG